MKNLIVLIVLVGLGLGGYAFWKSHQKSASATLNVERPTLATVGLRDISFAVNAAGEISPAEQVSVRPEINGLIETLNVDIGDRVKKNELLFKLDDKEL